MVAIGLADWQLGMCLIVALASSPVGQGNTLSSAACWSDRSRMEKVGVLHLGCEGAGYASNQEVAG